ncbi:MAG TPA: carbamoyltransferase HypF [Lacunisphaera sp.]|jgi:hydrogenase maturation protein HypF|nr:carbamoyltransferase HypF [Lacunisphaera sp.]
MLPALDRIASPDGSASRQRARVLVRGAVQGAGYRPFVFRLATELGLGGWVQNSPEGVVIEAEGPDEAVRRFLARLESEQPAHAVVRDRVVSHPAPAGELAFAIRESLAPGPAPAPVMPDLAPCPDCRRELFDPADRRHRYPFINCTRCGPRFTIIEALPYDRPNTAMRHFQMCARCAAEYLDPADRRFHAQSNACPNCGPQLAFRDNTGRVLARRDGALCEAVRRIAGGAIVALKGVGGFQLLVDARNDAAVRRLRERKHRPAKPFALLVADLAAARELGEVPPIAAGLLDGPAAPITLLSRRPGAKIAPSVAPGQPRLGLMLPASPLHHLVAVDAGGPLVATSGNRAEEPLCIDEAGALTRLAGIADFFLVHDRPIVRPVDDSVARVILGREQVLRRARGYAPAAIRLAAELPPTLALGAQMKSTVALSLGREVVLSQHLGDLESPPARVAFLRAVQDLPRLYSVRPQQLACDLSPGYFSADFGRNRPEPTLRVQHHHAHVLAAMAELGLRGSVLGVCWDGTGLGPDGTLWGGEFLRLNPANGYLRAARLRPFVLPGGDAAAREPRRSAIGLLHALRGDALWRAPDLAPLRAFRPAELPPLRQMIDRHLNCAVTSSAGRLFDAVASLAGVRQVSTFEGEAALALESVLEPDASPGYPLPLRAGRILELDWAPAVESVLQDLGRGVGAGRVVARFHRGLVEAIVAVATRVGLKNVILTGSCFQNAWLLEHAAEALRGAGFMPHWPRQVPPNDGGIALGQIMAAASTVIDRPGPRPA